MAKKNNVFTISIADHDTIDAYDKKLFNYAAENGIKLISGVEISTKINKCGIHVLGYNFDIDNDELKNRLFLLRNARHKYLHDVALKLKEAGYIVNVDKLDTIDAVTKAHIARDVISNKENYKKLEEDFNEVPSMGNFIETIMNENCPCYVKKESITPKEATNLIRQAGGKVVLAHPVAYQNEDGLTDKEILSLVNDMKPDGIESNYIYINRSNEKIDDTAKWNEFARQNNLFTTVGSDFHNIDEIRPNIGLINDIKLSEEEINIIINNILKKD